MVVETFANEISNSNETMSEEDMLIEMKGKVSVLMKLLKKVKGNDPKIKMVVLKLVKRYDNIKKQKISKLVREGEVKGARGSAIIVTSLPLQLETKMDKVRCNTQMQCRQIQGL